VAKETDFVEAGERDATNRFLVWLAAYRSGPLDVAELVDHTRLSEQSCESALRELVDSGQVSRVDGAERPRYTSDRFEVSMASEHGWEAAVIDHFQAMVAAITKKLIRGSTRSGHRDVTGGSTWSLDVWPGHPHYDEARATLARLRNQVDGLRARIDEHNGRTEPAPVERVVFYMGQHVVEPD
jgi:hypothetical protein